MRVQTMATKGSIAPCAHRARAVALVLAACLLLTVHSVVAQLPRCFQSQGGGPWGSSITFPPYLASAAQFLPSLLPTSGFQPECLSAANLGAYLSVSWKGPCQVVPQHHPPVPPCSALFCLAARSN